MKIKKILFGFILCAIGMHGAWGVSVCVPNVAQYAEYTVFPIDDATANGNRGAFTLGRNCNSAQPEYFVCANTADIAGESHCASGDIFSESGGQYCWCRITAITTTNGYVSPHNGAWVMVNASVDAATCGQQCSDICAEAVKSKPGARRAMVLSTQ